ncbi:MAG: hypothetical protein GXY33_20195 [Phycisphaerae bacterium]|nr:hypothetical protein [Phycisphaerae bacterium]
MTRLVLLTVLAMAVIGGVVWAATTTQPAAKDVLNRLLDDRPPVTPPKTTPAQEPSQTGGTFQPPTLTGPGRDDREGGHKLLPEGFFVADRRGRLTRSGELWMFVFEADGKTMGDPPIALLPNSWLEKMEADMAASPEATIFRISGEVTTYHGKNYLLLRKVLMERRFAPSYVK